MRRHRHPKGINSIALTQRHGSLLSADIFEMFQSTQKDINKDLLLSWNANDFCFCEIVRAILCIAFLGRNVYLVISRRAISSPKAGYSEHCQPPSAQTKPRTRIQYGQDRK